MLEVEEENDKAAEELLGCRFWAARCVDFMIVSKM